MVRLSVNVNKVATLRNSRGGSMPRVLDAVTVCLAAGAQGITVHPREDRRHITPDDVRDVAAALATHPDIEFNIEGDPRPELVAMVHAVHPHQCTLVPVVPGEITSHAGWREGRGTVGLREVVRDLKADGIRVALFVEADVTAVRFAADLGADRVELYTEPFARASERGDMPARESFAAFVAAANAAAAAGLGVNAGHDLDLDNLVLFRALPHLDEVSIGHAIMSRAIFRGLDTVVREYLDVLRPVL